MTEQAKTIRYAPPGSKPAAGIGHNQMIAEYDGVREMLDGAKKAGAATFDYHDKAGNTAARSHVHGLRKIKGELERVRKAAKAESLELGKRIDGQARTLGAEIESLIDIHAKPIKDIEDKEAARVERLTARVRHLLEMSANVAARWTDCPIKDLEDDLAMLRDLDMKPAAWDEFHEDAVEAHKKASEVLELCVERRNKAAKEAEELDELRKAKEVRDEADRVAAAAAEDKRLAEEREKARVAEEERIRAEEKVAAASREAELKRQAALAEKDRVAAEKKAAADHAAAIKETEARVKREAEEKIEADRQAEETRAANKRHNGKINKAAAEALVAAGLSQEAAKTAVVAIAKDHIPNVTIRY